MNQASAKRLFVGLMAAGMVVAACGGGGATTAPTATTATTAPTTAPTDGGASPDASPSGGFTLPEPEVSSIRIGMSVTETSQYAVKLAEQVGIFEKNGLRTEITVFEGDGKVMQALQAGQIDIGFGGTSSPITSQLTDVPAFSIATMANVLTDELVTAADVTSADDLRGKCVAVSTYGGTSHGAVLLSLEVLGLTPDDVTIQEVGGQSARIAALETGACQAAPIDISRHDEMSGKGLNFLVNLFEEKIPWGRSGMNVREDWAAEHPNTLTVALASVLEAQNLFWTDPDLVAENYAEFIQNDDMEDVKRQVLEFQEVGNRSLEWPDAAFENPKKTLETVNEALQELAATEAFDRTWIELLRNGGYHDQLGIPPAE